MWTIPSIFCIFSIFSPPKIIHYWQYHFFVGSWSYLISSPSSSCLCKHSQSKMMEKKGGNMMFVITLDWVPSLYTKLRSTGKTIWVLNTCTDREDIGCFPLTLESVLFNCPDFSGLETILIKGWWSEAFLGGKLKIIYRLTLKLHFFQSQT